MPELTVLTADGRTRTHALKGDKVGLGRATKNELCFPDDSGLSREHLSFERDGEEWLLRDAGSKNGTLLNGERVTTTRKLKAGDRIHAGHLTLVYGVPARAFSETVVFIDTRDEKSPISRDLRDALPAPEIGKATVGVDKVAALIKAGSELAGKGDLAELFPRILKLAIEAVSAERGVLLAYEGDSLDVKASSGGSFRI